MWLQLCQIIKNIYKYIPEIDVFSKPTTIVSLFLDEEAITTEGGLLNLPSAPWLFLTFVRSIWYTYK